MRILIAGASVFIFFAAFFALPLYAAATLCTMPCCHHESASTDIASADLPGCDGDCAVRTDEVTAASSVRFVAAASAQATPVPAVTAVPAPCTPQAIFVAGVPHASHSAPLHVLNSVFRI